MAPLLIDSSFSQNFCRRLVQYRDEHTLCDCILRVETQQSIGNANLVCHTDEIFAHRLVLAATSSFFKEIFLLKTNQKEPVTIVNLKFYSPNAVKCFKVILDFLYSGELHLRDCDPNHVFQVATVCQIKKLEDELRPSSENQLQKRLNLMSSFSPVLNSTPYMPVQSSTVSVAPTSLAVTLPTITIKDMCSNMIHHSYYGPLLPTTTYLLPSTTHFAPAYFPSALQDFPPTIEMPLNSPPPVMPVSTPSSPMNGQGTRSTVDGNRIVDQLQVAPKKTMAKRETRATLAQRLSPPDSPFDNLGDVIIPSTDNEGWCRNKKYIERIPKGFMCTLCRKIYGRYNSVSYHVTIYHRNPPIKCDELDCQFTTREARYIHFHKYYKHHIALPKSIDLGSRKCPLCRHVSKSPAMLEKHIRRHVSDCNRVGGMYRCPQCPKQLNSQEAMCDHILTHSGDKNYPCDQCNYKGQTENLLTQHVLFKHSSVMFKQKMRCKIDDCNFSSASIETLQVHKMRVHGKVEDAIDNADSLMDHSNRKEDEDDVIVGEKKEKLIDDDGDLMTALGSGDSTAFLTPPPE